MAQYFNLIRCSIFLLSLWHSAAYAHKPSDSYLTLSVQNNSTQKNINHNTAQGQWDIALRDFDYAIGLDANANSEITWQEVLTKQKEIYSYALARLSIKNNQSICSLIPKQLLIDHHTDGAYAVIKFNRVDEAQIGAERLVAPRAGLDGQWKGASERQRQRQQPGAHQ